MVPLLVLLLSKARRHHIAALLGAAFASIVVGAILFALTQQVSFGTGLYWAIVTAATVGYGDVTPHNSVGRVVAAAVILTTIPLLAAVFALVTGLAAVAQITRLLGMEHGLPEGRFTAIYGSHPSVLRIVEELVASGRHVALVADIDPSEVHHDVHFFAGDPTSEIVIRKSNPERAADALVVGEEDADVLVTCVALRSAAPNLPIYALAGSPKVAQALRDLGIRQTLSSDELVAHALAKSLEAPHAGDLLLRLIDSERYLMEEAPVGPEMVGRRASDLELGPAIVLGLIRDGDVKLVLDDDAVVQAGDVLVTLAARDGGRPKRRSASRAIR
jgi:voltage-gated potassium channel